MLFSCLNDYQTFSELLFGLRSAEELLYYYLCCINSLDLIKKKITSWNPAYFLELSHEKSLFLHNWIHTDGFSLGRGFFQVQHQGRSYIIFSSGEWQTQESFHIILLSHHLFLTPFKKKPQSSLKIYRAQCSLTIDQSHSKYCEQLRTDPQACWSE